MDIAKLREELRNQNEGRNLKQYWTERKGIFHCQRGDFVLWGRKKEQKTIRCDCGKRHPVIWEDHTCSRGCFDLCSFGWKDADLDPEGCTGIEKIVDVQGNEIVVEVKGHKTFCDPTYECEYELSDEDESDYSSLAHEIVCGGISCNGEWTGDDWCFSFSEEIRVKISKGKIDYEKIAKKIIRAARKAIEPYEKDWAYISKSLDGLYKEIKNKYSGELACSEGNESQ